MNLVRFMVFLVLGLLLGTLFASLVSWLPIAEKERERFLFDFVFLFFFLFSFAGSGAYPPATRRERGRVASESLAFPQWGRVLTAN